MLHLQHVHHRDVCACVSSIPSRYVCVLVNACTSREPRFLSTANVDMQRAQQSCEDWDGAIMSVMLKLFTASLQQCIRPLVPALRRSWQVQMHGIQTLEPTLCISRRTGFAQTIQSESATPSNVLAKISFQTTRLYVISCSKNVNSAKLDSRHFAENNDLKRYIWAHQARAKTGGLRFCGSLDLVADIGRRDLGTNPRAANVLHRISAGPGSAAPLR